MAVTTRSGKVLSEDDLDELVRQAEAGFDLSTWRPRRGRPALDADATEHSPRVSVRIPAVVRDRVMARAAAEGRSISDVLRSLLEDYARGSASSGDGSGSAAKTGSSSSASGAGPRRRLKQS